MWWPKEEYVDKVISISITVISINNHTVEMLSQFKITRYIFGTLPYFHIDFGHVRTCSELKNTRKHTRKNTRNTCKFFY